MLDQLIRALRWTFDNQIRSGRVEKILVSGHSSGAHMAALLAMQDWAALGVDAAAFLGFVCINGSYDLEPVLLSSRRLYIDLSEAEARQMSPILHAGRSCLPLHLLDGAKECLNSFASRWPSQRRLSARTGLRLVAKSPVRTTLKFLMGLPIRTRRSLNMC